MEFIKYQNREYVTNIQLYLLLISTLFILLISSTLTFGKTQFTDVIYTQKLSKLFLSPSLGEISKPEATPAVFWIREALTWYIYLVFKELQVCLFLMLFITVFLQIPILQQHCRHSKKYKIAT